MNFLTARVWLDEDGQHIWSEHDCTEGKVTTQLPTIWKADANGKVAPSIHCRKCGLHYMAEIEGERDAD